MTDRQDLIARLEQASEGSRELDAHVWACRNVDDGPVWFGDIPHYTTSLDSALSLVPEGWAFHRLNQYYSSNTPAWGWGAHLRRVTDEEKGQSVGESRATPALALCIAALKAQESG